MTYVKGLDLQRFLFLYIRAIREHFFQKLAPFKWMHYRLISPHENKIYRSLSWVRACRFQQHFIHEFVLFENMLSLSFAFCSMHLWNLKMLDQYMFPLRNGCLCKCLIHYDVYTLVFWLPLLWFFTYLTFAPILALIWTRFLSRRKN